MIYIRLAGGLGNQLYQLAAAVLVGRYTDQKVVVLPDALSFYAQQRTPDSLRLISSCRMIFESELHKGVLGRLITSGRVGRWLPIVGINDRSGLPIVKTVLSSVPHVMDGYFQRGWTASKFADALAEFKVASLPVTTGVRVAPDECVIHIRGGDFLSHDLHRIADVDYYIAAILRAKAGGWSRFAVMTDDLSHACKIGEEIRQHLPDAEMRVIAPAADALDDFVTLRNARARIIGNSTFAWWAAALDERSSPTWSPSKFLRGLERDFYLNWENRIDV